MGIEWVEWESYDMGIQSDGDKKQKKWFGYDQSGGKKRIPMAFHHVMFFIQNM
jgi:hypothetical protein